MAFYALAEFAAFSWKNTSRKVMKTWKWFIRINQILFYSQGRWGHTFLFLRKHLKFTTIQYTTYTTILGIIGLLGQYILVPILSGSYTFLRSYKLFNWKLHDSTISLLDATTRFEKHFILKFNSWSRPLHSTFLLMYPKNARIETNQASFSLT